MPCVSTRADNKWEEAMYLLYKDFAEAKAAEDQVVLMGDVNVSSLAEYLMTAGGHLFADAGRPAVREEQVAEPIGFPPAGGQNIYSEERTLPTFLLPMAYVPSSLKEASLRHMCLGIRKFRLKCWTTFLFLRPGRLQQPGNCEVNPSGLPLLHTSPNTSTFH